MNFNHIRTDLPILLIYNIDPSWPQQDIQDSLATTRLLAAALVEAGHPVHEVSVQSADLAMALKGFTPQEYLVFNWCEELPGIPHSAHLAAQCLEEMDFTYTGADTRTLALSQDKRLVKHLLQQQKIPIPTWQVYTSDRKIDWQHFPAIVKPAFEHCSYGITRESVVQSSTELKQRVGFVLDELQQPAMVEEFLDSREFHVGVIGNGRLQMLPPAEIDYSAFNDIHDRLCTFEANFDQESRAYQLTGVILPTDLSLRQLEQLESIVIAAYRATGCRDYARLDLRLCNDVFYVLDVNTNADISPDTSLVMAAEMIGLSYGRFGSLLVNLAAKRHPVFGQ